MDNKKAIELDAISKQAVLEQINYWIGSGEYRYTNATDYLTKRITSLPSVSTEKTGRWIRWYEVIESADGKSTDHIPHCKCSECDCEYDTYSSQFIKYCSNCGAKMGKRGA